MRPHPMLKVGSLLAAFSLTATLLAAGPPIGSRSSTTADTAQDLSQKASGLLAKVHQDAERVVDSADTLEEYDREANLISWQADALTLDTMRDQINKLVQTVYQLRVMDKNLPQVQQTEIAQMLRHGRARK